MARHQLTKSSYMAGRQCRKRLWLETHAPELKRPLSAAQQRILDQGIEIGKLAQRVFPRGTLVASHGAAAEAETARLVRKEAAVIFEGAFRAEGVLVRCDILRRTHNGAWDLIEVKGSTRAKPEHLPDLALQRYVLERCGLAVARTVLMHVSRRARPDSNPNALFVQKNVTKETAALLPAIASELQDLFATLTLSAAPEIEVGSHCTQPTQCAFHGHCWRDVPPTSIWFMPRMRAETKEALARRGINKITDLPNDQRLSPYQRRYMEAVTTKQDDIDRPAIRRVLDQLAYPLHFFDFETDGPALPRFQGMRPYDHFPFQYSLHILEKDGSLSHVEYLHERADDPRPHLLAALRRHVRPRGSLIVYNAQFERGVLRRLSEAFPTEAAWLDDLIARLWDQLEVFRRHYLSAAFQGSNSIKRVLPVLVPELSYADLDIQRGDDAQAVWNEMISEGDHAKRATLAQCLRAYCARDTLAMVAIHRRLTALCATSCEQDMMRK